MLIAGGKKWKGGGGEQISSQADNLKGNIFFISDNRQGLGLYWMALRPVGRPGKEMKEPQEASFTLNNLVWVCRRSDAV